MEAKVEIPPLLNPPPRTFGPALTLAAVTLAIIAAVVSSHLPFALPKCSLLKLTGIPCAACGGTRALRAIGHLQWTEAFWWNPLVTIGVIAAVIWFGIWLIAPMEMLERWILKMKKAPLVAIGIVLVALNWIFLLRFLPR